MNGEFEVCPGDGETREEAIRLAGIKTYLIVKVLKPYPQGTLDEVEEKNDGSHNNHLPHEGVKDCILSASSEGLNAAKKVTWAVIMDETSTGTRTDYEDSNAEEYRNRLYQELLSRGHERKLYRRANSLTLSFEDERLEQEYSSSKEEGWSISVVSAPITFMFSSLAYKCILPVGKIFEEEVTNSNMTLHPKSSHLMRQSHMADYGSRFRPDSSYTLETESYGSGMVRRGWPGIPDSYSAFTRCRLWPPFGIIQRYDTKSEKVGLLSSMIWNVLSLSEGSRIRLMGGSSFSSRYVILVFHISDDIGQKESNRGLFCRVDLKETFVLDSFMVFAVGGRSSTNTLFEFNGSSMGVQWFYDNQIISIFQVFYICVTESQVKKIPRLLQFLSIISIHIFVYIAANIHLVLRATNYKIVDLSENKSFLKHTRRSNYYLVDNNICPLCRVLQTTVSVHEKDPKTSTHNKCSPEKSFGQLKLDTVGIATNSLLVILTNHN
ncbi:hypothetical protein GQR58_023792 [Nymphon striatum]|nr:hypothetical protein GQR58_023792 [Nymphon striatum]